MPTYQYRCTACSEELEAVQKFTDDALTVCPACHGNLRKVFTAVGVVFKGSGFYKTDSRSSSKGATSSTGKDASSSNGDSSSSADSSSSPASGESSASSESKKTAPSESSSTSTSGTSTGDGSKVA